MKNADIINFLKEKVNLFNSFTEDKLTELVNGSRLTTFEENEAVIEFGEDGTFLGVLIDGEAEASVTDDSGVKHRVGLFHVGDFFGEISLMTGDHTIADVIGITRCTALLIPQVLFSTMLITNPKAVKLLSKSMSARIRDWAFDKDTGVNLEAAAQRQSGDPYGFNLSGENEEKVLVINCGSSSLKYTLYKTGPNAEKCYGSVEEINSDNLKLTTCSNGKKVEKDLGKGGYEEAFRATVEALMDPETGAISGPDDISAVGHRVVHGGDKYTSATVINDEVLAGIEELSSLAPLHNPVNIIGIRESMKVFPDAVQVAVFDTSFHHTIPNYAYLYGLPYEYYTEKKIRRYGFHGMSHFYVSLKASQYLKKSFNSLEIISCHLGNGGSVCAIDHGRSIDTSMGFTPAEGLIMGTRAGNIDPAILLHLMKTEGMDADALNKLINKESGLKGLSGVSNDMRRIQAKADEGDHRAIVAFKAFAYSIRKYIGSYAAAMQGLDVVIFTGGIGQGNSNARSLACQRLDFMGIEIDEKKNRNSVNPKEVVEISTPRSKVKVLVVPTDEELMIARETLRSMKQDKLTVELNRKGQIDIPVEVSAHHCHLSRKDVDGLFGKGYELQRLADLSQPGQFACKETVDLVGPKGVVNRVRVLGPERPKTQVEIALTEQFKLGVQPPIRESGDVENTPGVTLRGPKGEIDISEGVICAQRHIHMSPEDALNFGVRDRYNVRVKIEGDREMIYGDVLVRVHPNFRLALHLDTDEANAGNVRDGDVCHIESVVSKA